MCAIQYCMHHIAGAGTWIAIDGHGHVPSGMQMWFGPGSVGTGLQSCSPERSSHPKWSMRTWITSDPRHLSESIALAATMTSAAEAERLPAPAAEDHKSLTPRSAAYRSDGKSEGEADAMPWVWPGKSSCRIFGVDHPPRITHGRGRRDSLALRCDWPV